MKLRCLAIPVLLSAFLAAPSGAGPARESPVPAAAERDGVLRLSIEEGVAIALRNAAEVRIGQKDMDRARGVVEESGAIRYPHVEAQLSYDKMSDTKAIFGSMGDAFSAMLPPDLDLTNSYVAGVTVSQVLYQGGQIRAGLAAARLSRDQAGVGYQLARIGVACAARLTYAGLLVRLELEDVAEESLALARRFHDDVTARRNAGTATDFHVLQAKVRVRNAEAARFKARAQSLVGRDRLLRRLCLDQGREVELTDDLPGLVVTASRDLGGSHSARSYLLKALGSEAVGPRADGRAERPEPHEFRRGGRLELQLADLVTEMQDVGLSVSTAGRRPSVTAYCSYSGNSSYDYFDDGFDLYWRAGVSLRLPVFDGHAARGKHTQALAELAQAELRREGLARDIGLEVRSAYSRVETAREFVASAAENVEQAAEAVRQAEVRYRNGLARELELEEARLGLVQARTNLAQARFELYASALELQRAAGLLRLP